MPDRAQIENNKLQGKKLYLILWVGTFLIGMPLFIMEYQQDLYEKELQKNTVLSDEESSGKSINDLLLSADELTIAEKKSFINLYLKPGDKTEAGLYKTAKQNHEEVYKIILQRKMNKLKKKQPDDFSIKPLPK